MTIWLAAAAVAVLGLAMTARRRSRRRPGIGRMLTRDATCAERSR